MSAGAPALIPTLGRRPTAAEREDTGERPLLRLGAFAGLAVFGVLRWGALMSPAPTGRLLGLAAVAVAIVILGPPLAARSRAVAVLGSVLAALAMLLISGMHWSWLRHVRLAVGARAVGNGLDALPRMLVPYHGTNPSVRMVLTLGAALLLFDAAIMLAFSAQTRGQGRAGAGGGDLRRAIAAMPLIALAAVPLTLVPARFQYAEGAVLFVLLAALVWGERLPRRGAGTAAFVCGLACVLAMVAAPWLDTHKPWIHYQTLANGLSVGSQETFNWSQTYSALSWPRDGREVLEVKAAHGDYWKATDLDAFNGFGWAQASGLQAGPDGVSAATRQHWTQTVTVTVAAMTTQNIFGPGDLTSVNELGTSTSTDGLGNWTANEPLGPGDSYKVTGYEPHPTATQLQTAGTDYPQSIVPTDLQLVLPPVGGAPGAGNGPIVWSDPYGAATPILYESDLGEQQAARLLATSPYSRAFALAQHLRATTLTPYEYVTDVMRMLAHGYTYDEQPPASEYPLETFLFSSKRGYCQQFAGAMALLLRLGGIPARVVAGFTSGQYDAAIKQWLVTDYDAHAWVEVFFPGYGWVRFDPTPPSADPAQQTSHLSPITGGGSSDLSNTPKPTVHHGLDVPGGAAAGRRARAHHGGGLPVGPILAVLAALLLAAGVFATRPLRDPSPERMLDELERAFARSGRPLAPQLTLAELERRLDGRPGAVSYVRAVSGARFGVPGSAPTGAQRRALRAALCAGLGLTGRLRALWALPPRW